MATPTETPPIEPCSDQGLPSKDSVLAEAIVLICAPDAKLRSKIEDLLRSAEFATVIGVTDIAAAADHCAASPPEVVLFHATNGVDIDQALTDKLRALNAARNLSVIYLDTNDAPDRRKTLLALGDDCISLARELDELPRRTLVHATLHCFETAVSANRHAMEQTIEKRTNRLNNALDLLREAEKRLQGELSQTKTESRERIDYFAETQHELRTPLNAICGMSDAIRNEMFGALDNPKYKDYADNIYQSGQHLLSIIDGRLELSRIEAGADPLDVEDVDVGCIIHETTEMLGRIAEKANVALEVDIEPDLPIIETDPRKLRQVLLNLVSNAIKFTPEKGRVLLSAKRNAKRGVLILVVSDTGIGMSPDEVGNAMQPYRRMAGDHRSGEKGTGLGLSIVRKLVETMGATIQIQSAPGKGTSIKVELPLSAPGGTDSLRATG